MPLRLFLLHQTIRSSLSAVLDTKLSSFHSPLEKLKTKFTAVEKKIAKIEADYIALHDAVEKRTRRVGSIERPDSSSIAPSSSGSTDGDVQPSEAEFRNLGLYGDDSSGVNVQPTPAFVQRIKDKTDKASLLDAVS